MDNDAYENKLLGIEKGTDSRSKSNGINESVTDSNKNDKMDDDTITEAEVGGRIKRKTETDSVSSSAKVQKAGSPETSTRSQMAATFAGNQVESERQPLRDYQKEVSKNVLKQQNDIIILPTGTGKTAVAANLVLRHLEVFRNQGRSDKAKVLFLVPRVVLADQQLEVIKNYLGDKWSSKCRRLVGGDLDSMETLKNLMLEPEYSVLVATPKTIVNYFHAYRCSTMKDFTLIIFDECHNAKGNEPYNELLIQYLKEIKETPNDAGLFPQLVGMTATVGIGGAKTKGEAKSYIMSVCAKFGLSSLPAEVVEFKEELDGIMDEPMKVNEKVDSKRKDPFSDYVKAIMRKIIEQVKDKLNSIPGCKGVSTRFRPPSDMMDRSLPQKVNEVINDLKITIEGAISAEMEDCKKCLKHLEVYNQALQWANLATLESSLDYIEEKMEDDTLKECDSYKKYTEEWLPELKEKASREKSEYPNKKLLALQKELDKVLKADRIEDDYNPRMMVFVEQRRLAFMISDWLNDLGEEYKSKPCVSSQVSTAKFGMTPADAKKIVEQFRDGELNILVATSVLSEGVDIPECNCVIRYMYIKDVIAEVQVPGRVRSKNGSIVAIFDDALKKQYDANKMSEKRMAEALTDIRGMADVEFAQAMTSLRESQYRDITKKEAQDRSGRPVTDVQVVCRVCKKMVGHLADVHRYMSVHYVVIDPRMKDNIDIIADAEGERIDAMTESGLLLCKHCSNAELGKIYKIKVSSTMHKSIARWEVKKVSLKMPGEDQPRSYKRWADVKANFAIPDVMHEDLLQMAEDGKLLDLFDMQ